MTLPKLVNGQLSPNARLFVPGSFRGIKTEVYLERDNDPKYKVVVYVPTYKTMTASGRIMPVGEHTIDVHLVGSTNDLNKANDMAHNEGFKVWKQTYGHIKENPLGDNPFPLIMGLGAIAALAVGIYIATKPSTAASTAGSTPGTPGTLPGLPGMPGTPGVPNTPPLPNFPPVTSTAQWTPVTTLTQGRHYRVSANMPGYFALKGYKVFTDGMPIPSDWPTSDLDSKRWRAEAKWQFDNSTVTPQMTALGFRFFEKNASGQWVPATNLVTGKLYRASVDARAAAQTQGVTLIVSPDQIPTDWPANDRDPSKWRADGTWTMSTSPIDPSFFNALGLKIYEFQP